MKCLKCGNNLEKTDFICTGCGTAVKRLKSQNLIEYEEVSNNDNGISIEKIESEQISNQLLEEKTKITNNKKENKKNQHDDFDIEETSTFTFNKENLNTKKESIPVTQPLADEALDDFDIEETSTFLFNNFQIDSDEDSKLLSDDKKDDKASEGEKQIDDKKSKPVKKIKQKEPKIEKLPKKKNKSDKKNKLKITLIIITIVVFALVLLVGGYYFLMCTPHKIFNKTISELYAKVNIQMKDNKTLQRSFELSVDVNPNTYDSSNSYQTINGLNIEGQYGIDFENKQMSLLLNSTYQNDLLLNSKVFIKDNNAYIYLENLYDKYITIPIDGYSESFAKIDDYSFINGKIKTALLTSLKDAYFTSEQVSLTINGKPTSLIKNTLTLNSEQIISVLESISDNLKNDQSFVKIYNKVTGLEEDIIPTEIEAIIGTIKDQLASSAKNKITSSIYTKLITNEFIKFDINIIGDNTNSFVLLKNSKNKYNFNIKINDSITNGVLDISKSSDNNIYNISLDKEDFGKIKITSSFSNTVYNEDIQMEDVTNSIMYSELTSDEINNITDSLSQKEKFITYVPIANNLN